MRALMATILAFRQQMRADTLASVCEPRAMMPAEIVLFPGVRYERWEDMPPTSPKPRKRAKKRDKLVVHD